ncbi:MAG: M48 family metallopeptidase [Mycobacteriaceae bacterium]
MPAPKVVLRRSTRRRRTVSAHREGDTVVVALPARLSAAVEQRWVADVLARLQRAEDRAAAAHRRSDADLLHRCGELSRQYLRGLAEPAEVRWVPSMLTRWASCTPARRSIRVAERLRRVPAWVLDYVLVHELAHLLEAGHGPGFWALVNTYPRTERARGYLEGLSAAAELGNTELDGSPQSGARDAD